MANQLILNPQKFNFGDLISQIPPGKFKKKVFFQSELRNLDNGDATFGVIAYAAWKGKDKWDVGTKISGTDTGTPDIKPFVPPLAFANNELLLAAKFSRKKKKPKKKDNAAKQSSPAQLKKSEFLQLVKKVSKNKKLIAKTFFLFKASISKNPHLRYDVTLDFGGTTVELETNPSPPARPED